MRMAVCILCVILTPASAPADVLLDQMDMVRHSTYDYANGNAIGGEVLFDLEGQASLQICNDFRTTQTGYIITQVEVANLIFYRETRIVEVRVSIYPDEGGIPGEDPVYSERLSTIDGFSPVMPLRITNTPFDDDLIGLFGVWTIVSGLHIELEPDTTYFISVQVVTGPDDWGYTVRHDVVDGADSYCRDGPPEEDECQCGYGFTDWHAIGETGRPEGDAAYRVIAGVR